MKKLEFLEKYWWMLLILLLPLIILILFICQTSIWSISQKVENWKDFFNLFSDIFTPFLTLLNIIFFVILTNKIIKLNTIATKTQKTLFFLQYHFEFYNKIKNEFHSKYIALMESTYSNSHKVMHGFYEYWKYMLSEMNVHFRAVGQKDWDINEFEETKNLDREIESCHEKSNYEKIDFSEKSIILSPLIKSFWERLYKELSNSAYGD